MATKPERTPQQKRGIIITVVMLAVLAGIFFISAFLKEWR